MTFWIWKNIPGKLTHVPKKGPYSLKRKTIVGGFNPFENY